MFSVVALPAALAHLSPRLIRAGSLEGVAAGPDQQGVPFGFEELDELLPDRGLLRGGVVELSVAGGAGLATALALAAVRSAQEQARALLSSAAVPWCAFVNASGSN